MLCVLTTEQDKEAQGNFWGVLDMPGTVTVGMVPWLHAYVQTRQIVHIKCVQCFICQPHINKAVQKPLPQRLRVCHPEENQKKIILLMRFVTNSLKGVLKIL